MHDQEFLHSAVTGPPPPGYGFFFLFRPKFDNNIKHYLHKKHGKDFAGHEKFVSFESMCLYIPRGAALINLTLIIITLFFCFPIENYEKPQ